jgi:hypothetical protein
MTEGSRPEGAVAARASALDLAAQGWRDIRGSIARLWPVWLAWAVFNGAAQYLGHEIQPPGGGIVWSPRFIAHELGASVGAAVFSGLCLRVFLAPEEPLWRLGRGFFAYVGLVALASLLTLVVATQRPPPASVDPAQAGAYLGVALGMMAAFFVGTWAAIRLMLWPIGLLLGDRAVTLGESWRRMRGMVWPYIGASIVLGGLPFLVSLVFASQYFAHNQMAALILGQPFTTFYAITGVAVGAAVYRARVGAAG